MRTVYTHDVEWRIYLLDGSVIKKNPFRNSYSRLVYKYGEKPENKIEEHCVKKLDNKDEQSRVFEELIRTMQFETEYHGHHTLFKKRLFLESGWFGKKIFMDQLIGWEIRDIYQTVENPDLFLLQRDLRFKEYSQLIFDREQELRSILNLKEKQA